MMRRRSKEFMVAITAVIGLFLTAAAGGVAQESSGDAVPHPAHIHAGTCADLDPNPAYPLTDVSAVLTDAATPEASGAASAIPVELSVTTLAVPLADLLAGNYAINVHESADNIERYIACGDIGGTVLPSGDGELAIGMREQNDSGYAGIAWLQANADGGTTVTIFLAQGLTEAGSAAAAAADAQDVTVSIVDFAFEPVDLEVKVGATVTWTNEGPTDHTTTAYDGGDKIWDSGILTAGQSYSYTFDEPGSFEYLCTLHPNMTARLNVVA